MCAGPAETLCRPDRAANPRWRRSHVLSGGAGPAVWFGLAVEHAQLPEPPPAHRG
jgi:hypothetical protein